VTHRPLFANVGTLPGSMGARLKVRTFSHFGAVGSKRPKN